MKSYAVIGLGFGDEGKGRVVDHLARISPAYRLVMRFTGGHQAGHHVVLEDGRDHIFSHFGCGTFRITPTWWSQYCPMSPVSLLNERDVLCDKGAMPVIYIDDRAPVTTPYEIVWNEQSSELISNGTCGKGIFATLQRERDHFHLQAGDLLHPYVLRKKIEQIAQYYEVSPSEEMLEDFFRSASELRVTPGLNIGQEIYAADTAIFEGSQGLLLDEEYGFFPNVTPSQTGTQRFANWYPEVWLVTRAYQTRHGAGPMSPMVETAIKNNPYEQNGDDGPQGDFRRTLLDLAMLRYAVAKDQYIRSHKKTLVITCMDLVQDDLRLQDSDKGEIIECENEEEMVEKIRNSVGAERVLISRQPFGDLEETK